MNKAYEMTLELYNSGVADSSIVYYRGDQNVYPVTFYLLKKGNPYKIPPGADVYVNILRPDHIAEKCKMEVLDAARGTVSHIFEGSALSVAGKVTASIELQTSEKRLTWQSFRFNVYCPLDDNGAVAPQAYSEWTRDIHSRLISLEEDGVSALDEISTSTAAALTRKNIWRSAMEEPLSVRTLPPLPQTRLRPKAVRRCSRS